MTVYEKEVHFDDGGEENEPLTEYGGSHFRAHRWERLKSLLVCAICGGFLLSYVLLLLAYVESANIRVDADPFQLGLEGRFSQLITKTSLLTKSRHLRRCPAGLPQTDSQEGRFPRRPA